MNDDTNTSANDTTDVSRIVPERALQQIADDHDINVDALRLAVREDLERNQWMADEILDCREVVYRDDNYLVVHAREAVSTETPIPVLSVYQRMDDSDIDWTAGYPLVVTTIDDTDGCPYDFDPESPSLGGDR